MIMSSDNDNDNNSNQTNVHPFQQSSISSILIQFMEGPKYVCKIERDDFSMKSLHVLLALVRQDFQRE